MIKRNELTDIEWQRLEPYLPPQKPKTGRPARTHRDILNGIVWILRTGAPWRDLPERYGGIKRNRQGRPTVRSLYLAGDKAYSSEMARNSLRSRGIIPVIPYKSNELKQSPFDRERYRMRNRVERLFNRLKQFRMWTIGAILIWLK